jgi:hypothetical protein
MNKKFPHHQVMFLLRVVMFLLLRVVMFLLLRVVLHQQVARLQMLRQVARLR